MASNAADIVSRRSVERVYFSNEPQFTRFFVKKYQLRPPLVNRSFHLRIHLVDIVVRHFLLRPSSKSKVIVHLGCGSDALPWRSIYRNKLHFEGAKFVDVDSPEVINTKCEIIQQTLELNEGLTNLKLDSNQHTVLSSDQYYQVACELCQLENLNEALSKITDVYESEFLFIAENSLSRLKVEAADALIQWASTLGDADFCLIEQNQVNDTVPAQPPSKPRAGDSNQGIGRYPTTDSQRQRFRALGWPSIEARTLWESWSDPALISSDQRQKLDEAEAFDEWEDFVHFASHHFILRARSGALVSEQSAQQQESAPACAPLRIPTTKVKLQYSPYSGPKSVLPRRFGAPMLVRSVLGEQSVVNTFGQGPDGNLRSHDVYGTDVDPQSSSQIILSQGGPGARSFFTLTDLGDYGYLLSGGRTLPSAPFHDCWIFKKDVNRWVKTHSLPLPLFGHMAERLGHSQLVFVAGGRSSPTALNPNFYLYHPNTGWMRCVVEGTIRPPALFGGLLLDTTPVLQQRRSEFCGILAGGMTSDALISDNVYDWILDVSDFTKPTISFKFTTSHWASKLFARYGAASTRVNGSTVVVGGVTSRGCIPQDYEFVRFCAYGEENEKFECLSCIDSLKQDMSRPVLTGASVVATAHGEIVLVGGGTSRSLTETAWTRGVYSFDAGIPPLNSVTAPANSQWSYQKTLAITNEAPATPREPNLEQVGLSSAVSIPRLTLGSAEHFLSILQSGQPVVFEGLDLGLCRSRWSIPYLVEHVGPERKVAVHESKSQAMDFLAKNFKYNTQTFQEFAHDVDAGKRLYLRALSADKPSEAPARLDVDFPSLSRDFTLPPQLAFVQDRLFSSVLRVSGPVNMWLHYDVLANIYCQIRGTKRFYLFPPSDVTHLGFAPGASSSSIDVFSSLASASLSHCHPYETVLEPGDVLFLPQLWLHTATPVSSSSIAVNVFFRDLAKGYSSGKDVYGNRDLAAYEKARQDVSRISKSFKDLPRDTRQFYLGRIADELLQIASE